MTSKWNYCPLTSDEQQVESDLAKSYAGVPPVSELLVQRGISSVREAEKFFHPSLKDLHDPFLMPDMDKAVHRLNRAMGAKEQIMVYGDYDVDGTTAVALVYKYLRNFYSHIDYYIPTRNEDGYGISKATIDMAARQGVKLFIILDCGIKATEEIEYARSLGIDFIICDHHVPDEKLPPAVAILNPKLDGSTYPCPHLSGCGVGYKLMQAFAISNGLGNTELEGLLDLVAVSIAADIVPMVGENRILTYHGLKRLNSNPNMGLRAIIRICGLGNREITISDVIFKIGPRINASGRMGMAEVAVELFLTRDPVRAETLALELCELNRERQEIEGEIFQQCVRYLEENPQRSAIVLACGQWHQGVVGIVASRLAEKYACPCFMICLDGGMGKGSCRSWGELNLFDLL